MEYHDIINSVEEFRFEDTAYFFHYTAFHPFIVLLLIII